VNSFVSGISGGMRAGPVERWFGAIRFRLHEKPILGPI